MKLGRKAPKPSMRTVRSAFVMEQHLNSLGPAPAVSNDYVAAVDKWTGGDWTMMGNDTIGDCTCADSGHGLLLRTANTGAPVLASTASVVAMYSAITGYDPNYPDTDAGATEEEVLQYMVKTGLLQHKASSYGSVDPTNLDHVKWCCQIFGTCRLGIMLPQSAMDQTNAGKPWDVIGAPATNFLGGHDVPVVKYDGSFLYVVTWGKLQAMTPRFLAAYADEAHSELDFDWIAQNGASPSGFNLAQLFGDILAVE